MVLLLTCRDSLELLSSLLLPSDALGCCQWTGQGENTFLWRLQWDGSSEDCGGRLATLGGREAETQPNRVAPHWQVWNFSRRKSMTWSLWTRQVDTSTSARIESALETNRNRSFHRIFHDISQVLVSAQQSSDEPPRQEAALFDEMQQVAEVRPALKPDGHGMEDLGIAYFQSHTKPRNINIK